MVYCIVDFNHIAWNYAHSNMDRLTYMVNINGVSQLVDTTIANGALKALNRWSGVQGTRLAVCFDRPCPARKDYFKKLNEEAHPAEGDSVQYKGGRKGMSDGMYQAVTLVRDTLHQAGVTVIQADGYEADDLVMATIQKIRSTGDYETPIHVVTNDTDLVPLVDGQISVFLRSRKFTYAVESKYEKNKYVQVTPDNYEEILSDMSAFKNLSVPYNSVLLVKILRGDKTDNIQGYGRDLPPRHLNEIVEAYTSMSNKPFLYGMDDEYLDEALNDLGELLEWYRSENPKVKYSTTGVLEHVEKTYRGMDLNGYLPGRVPAKVKLPAEYSYPKVAGEAIKLGINLKPC